MSDTIIKVENLSKKYILSHQQEGRSQYVSLRDELTKGVKSLGKKLITPFSKNGEGKTSKEEFWALKDISFEVKQGEVIGIIGRNGAGKSTLLKILSRITEPTAGRVTIKGRVASLLEVGTGFHPELTGRENIYLNGAILGMSKEEIKRKFDEIVDFAEVEKFLDTPVKRYSSGMYVRLAFAVAAHLEPEILIVDEVLAVGDAAFQKKCLGKMGDVATKEGRTVLFVSHNMSTIIELCENSILFKNGKIDYFGLSQKTINQYLSFTQSLYLIDLTQFKHNGPQKYATLTSLEIYDETMNHCLSFLMGSTIIARIGVKCKQEFKNAEIGLKISSKFGIPIHYLTSTWEGCNWDINIGQYIFEVKVPNISLLPGKYILGVWILMKDNWSDDNVQDITMIEIVSNNITGFSANFEKYCYSGSEVYTPSYWQLI
jgi:lipopolysaccharide transport system ATP-binding protein